MATTPSEGWRVKLYQLNADGQWGDIGTGFISVNHMDVFGGPGILVSSEKGGRDLLQSRILENREAYSLQGENIITWEEKLSATASVDLALSFQENEGCLLIWNQIQEIQGNYALGSGHSFLVRQDNGDDDGMIGPTFEGSRYELKDLPECRINNLELIRDQIMCPAMHRENVAGMLIDSNFSYLKKLIALFDDLEDLEDEDNLKLMSQVMRCVVVLNDSRLLECILVDSTLYQGVLGSIEYDPELQEKGKWRKFLNESANFIEVISMDNHVDLRNSIHTAFRASLLRDAATRPGMEDGALSGLIQYLYFAHSEIISNLIKEKLYLEKIVLLCLGDVKSEELEVNSVKKRKLSESRGLALRFLQEMLSIAKAGNIPMSTRDSLYSLMLQELPLFEALTNSLSDFSLSTKEMAAAAEVLSSLVTYDQGSAFRLHILKTGAHPINPTWVQQGASSSNNESNTQTTANVTTTSDIEEDKVPINLKNCPAIPCKTSLLSVLLHLLAYDDDMGCILHYNEILSKCIEVEMMDPTEKDAFLSVFYDYYIHWLADPLVRDERKVKIVTKSTMKVFKPTTISSSSSSTATNPPITSSSDTDLLNQVPTEESKEIEISYAKLTYAEKQSRAYIADLLSYCVKAHTYRMRYFVLRNGLCGRVSELCKHPEKYLKLSGLRFIRAAIGSKDDFLNRHIVKKDHFAIVFQVFVQNNAKDNLISSAVIDIIEFIRTENMSRLIKYTIEGFPGIFDNINYVSTFKALQLKYEQNIEYETDKGEGTEPDNVKEVELRKVKACDDEEAYFDADDEDTTEGFTPPDRSKSPVYSLSDAPPPNYLPGNTERVLSPRASQSPQRDPEKDLDMLPTVMPGTNATLNQHSPTFKTRPVSPPVDSLGMMFDMKNRAPVVARSNGVRKIEMVIGASLGGASLGGAPGVSMPSSDTLKETEENGQIKRQKL